MRTRWSATIYVKRYFAVLRLVSLIMQTERNIAEDVRFICITVASFVPAAEWL